MADLRISQLNALAGADLASADLLVAVDDSASETKKLTVGDLIANGVTLIADDTIPGAKILFAAGGIATADLADGAVTTAKLADDGVTAAKLADESTIDLVTTLPASGAFTGQLALDTDDNFLYVWDGSAWVSLKAAGSINTVNGDTAALIDITATTSGSTVTIAASIDDTTVANQFLAGPTGAGGTVAYRVIDSTDLPTSSTTAKGAVLVNGEGLRMDGDTIEVDNDVTDTTTHHVVTYSTKGLITGGRALTSADLPLATSIDAGAIIPGDGLAVDVNGNLSIDNTVATGTYTKVTVTAEGVVSTGDTLDADDIPDHSAAKLTSGTIGSSIIADDAVTAAKLADESTTLFAGASGSDDVTTFPDGDFKGQFFYDETGQDLYIYTGTAFVPITVLSGNLVNAGAYNASTNLMSSVTTAGSSAGFSVGAALPAPAGVNLNHYVVVDTSGTGSGAAPAVALAPPDMLLSQGVGTEYQLIDVSNAIAGQTASNISLIATGDITATDVQAGIQELDTEKLPKAGGTMTGDLTLNNVNVVFEGSTADDYETTLTVTDPTADRTIALPNVSGTVVTTGDTGSVTSTMITDGTIVNADINASAEIAVSKLANGTARQLLQTDAAGTGVEFTSDVDIPGTLDVTGAVTLDSTASVAGLLSADGKISYTAGTAALPALYSGSDTNTGIYYPGADQFGISTAGTARFYIAADGKVGIGETTMDALLVIKGNSDANTTPSIRLKDGTDTREAWITNTAGDLILSNGGDDNVPHCYLKMFDGNVMTFATANAERMRIDSSGNVGIGTSSPSYKLEVNGSIHINNSSAQFIAHPSDTAAAPGYTWGGQTTGMFLPANGTLGFSTVGTERMRISASGHVGIGTTTLIDEATGTNDGATFYSQGILGLSCNGDRALFIKRRNSNGNVAVFLRDTTGVGSISVTTTSTSYNTSSDYRLKENVVDIADGITRVKQLAPKRFNFIDDADTTVDGFLAHEAQTVVPEAVTGTQDETKNIGTLTEWDGTVLNTDITEPAADELTWEETTTDEDGNETVQTRTRTWTQTGSRPVYQGIDQAKLVPLLTAALQEAIAKIETLETKVAALEAE